MSMFTICPAFVLQGQLETSLKEAAAEESRFTAEIGVLSRHFFQCIAQPHIIWSNTEWVSERHHNDAAQSLMGERRDDRIASIMFGPEPYFEIFCDEDGELAVGDSSDGVGLVIVAHGVISARARENLLGLRRERLAEVRDRLDWLRVYHNTYNADEFVAFLGFADEAAYDRNRPVGDFLLEEYLLTGLRAAHGMAYIASYNQFVCAPLSMNETA